MKLQFKLALYNTLTKVAIITGLGIVIAVSINHISISHIQKRLLQKKIRLIANLSNIEVNDLLLQKTFTDYNLLREEYIILKEIKKEDHPIKQKFMQEFRSIEGKQEEFQILITDFSYEGKSYRLELGETMSTLAQLEHTISMFTFGILIAAVILTLIIDLGFMQFLLAPFYLIIDQKLNKVNDPINFNYQPVKTSTDDFKILDQSISVLMNKIATLFLTEKEFIANVSHELLTPISILNTRLENLLNDEQLSPEGENKLFACLKTLNRLKAIINSLLLISKVENQQYGKTDIISVKHTVEEVHEELEHRLLMMKLKMHINLTDDYAFTGNKSLFHTLLMNLINNAIKYNKRSGSVNIYNEPSSEGYTLVIADTGLGMDPEVVQNAFIRFEKLQSEKEDSHGLGLAIVRSIAAFHDIHVDITSQKGTGTKVRIIFPN
ncbi:MAG: HAMP domain-containing sensor histidine kinase [Candidatus Pedobacter colombiensis]|uniref:histidine kinase n=1 Tax=Candidatus Pedobacter colombiensis TaxID=3121371 RepID=A0AAJ5WBB8_9SPHI|nr:HAMP domain-containing sensor histidine kinase [Pedobacter sp.]WEK20309.1 MAG: HAMP domain-containing sensor histidine kinase [Pedobacter sp.]